VFPLHSDSKIAEQHPALTACKDSPEHENETISLLLVASCPIVSKILPILMLFKVRRERNYPDILTLPFIHDEHGFNASFKEVNFAMRRSK